MRCAAAFYRTFEIRLGRREQKMLSLVYQQMLFPVMGTS